MIFDVVLDDGGSAVMTDGELRSFVKREQGRYAPPDTAEESAQDPAAILEMLLKEEYEGEPLVDGFVVYDDSGIGGKAIPVTVSTVPGLPGLEAEGSGAAHRLYEKHFGTHQEFLDEIRQTHAAWEKADAIAQKNDHGRFTGGLRLMGLVRTMAGLGEYLTEEELMLAAETVGNSRDPYREVTVPMLRELFAKRRTEREQQNKTPQEPEQNPGGADRQNYLQNKKFRKDVDKRTSPRYTDYRQRKEARLMTDRNNTRKAEWERENMRTISCRLRREEAEKFKKYAEYRGTSPHGLLSEYVKACNELEAGVPQAEKADVLALRKEIESLKRKLKVAEAAVDQARDRALRAEALVDAWLRSADGE